MSSRSRPPTPNASTPLRTCRSACSFRFVSLKLFLQNFVFRTFIGGIVLCVVALGAIHAVYRIHAFDSLRLRVIDSCGWPVHHSCVSLSSGILAASDGKSFLSEPGLPAKSAAVTCFYKLRNRLACSNINGHSDAATTGYCLASLWRLKYAYISVLLFLPRLVLTPALRVAMQNFVENFSEFSAAQRNAGKHVTIMSELSRLVDARTLMQVHLQQASLSLL